MLDSRGGSAVAEAPGTDSPTPVRTAARTLARTTLVVERFIVDAQLVENAICGNGNGGSFETECRLVVEGLDDNGFVVEVHSFIEAVQRAYADGMRKASCEELAGGVINVAHRLIGPRLTEASATVYNQTGHVEVDWERGNEVPAFPRTATAQETKATRKARREPRYEPRGC